ncbi:hypothetical protein RJ53_02005 [Methanocalculus chunghsingensis]|uniref:DUF2109 domain-containing protein n=1 Tax=Methanocalculus chunghsingensis TaxID=156457 RepID=A0A8J8B443_9EURY|nr:DUF2109 family protein [Methanocalculus chunghsingensis]MBR1368336.1 hypothetical protein [Methanocalculus chunghsingensis]
MIAAFICLLIAVYGAIRAVAEQETLTRLPFINVMNFGIAGTIVLLLPHPLTLVAAAAYFIGSTLEANAIASAYAKRGGT